MTNSKKYKIFDSKIFWAIISLFVSLIIWVYINGTQEEIINLEFKNVELVFVGEDALQDSRGLYIADVTSRTVDIEISGTRMNIGGLSAKDIKAQIDVSRITSAGTNTNVYLPVFPESVDASAVTIVSRTPSQIQFTVTRMSNKTVEVKSAFTGSTAEGYVAGKIEFEPGTITISGPQSELDKIDHVYVELGGEDITRTRERDLPYVLRDANGNVLDDLTGLEFEFDTIHITLPITMTKTVELSVEFIYGAGVNKDNYTQLLEYSIDPETITIEGDPEIIETYNTIRVTTIDLTDFQITHEDTFTIPLANGIKNITGINEASVKIELSGLDVKQLDVTDLSWINLPEGYTAEIVNKSINVKIRADKDVIKQIKSENLRAVADMAEITSTGDIAVPVKIYVDGFTDAGAIGEYTIIINVSG